MKNKQSIKGNNNIQIGVNNGDIIKTERVIHKTEVIHDEKKHITIAQAKKIQDKIFEIAQMTSADKEDKRKFYSKEYRALYNKFDITSYKLLPADKFDEAIMFLQKRIAFLGKPKLRRAAPEKWVAKQCGAIYTRGKQLGMNKEDILLFAENYLELKKPIHSLKELSKTRLNKLYKKIFSTQNI